MRRALAPLLVAAVLAVGCGAEAVQRQPVAPDDGLSLSGRVGLDPVNLSHGEPEVLLADCDRDDGPDLDLCIVSRTIEGVGLAFVIENPEALRPGARLPVAASCRGERCQEVAVVELRRDGERMRANGGTLEVIEAGPRYAATFTLRFRGGSLSGRFNVLPAGRPAPPATP